MADYAQSFISLAKFAPDLIITDDRKVKKFIYELKPSIRQLVLDRGG